jgi:predicted secreted protein
MRISLFTFLMFSLLLPVSAAIVAEGSTAPLVEGMVTSEGKGVPAIEINIWDGQTNRKTISDGEGKFKFSGLEPGAEFALRFSPEHHRSVRADGFRFPEKGNLYLNMEYTKTEKGQRHTLRVPSNPSTGYEWFLLQQGDTAVAAFRGNMMETEEKSEETPGKNEWKAANQGEFKSPQQSTPPRTGKGGWERWTFQTFREGHSIIVLGYFRPWETGVSPARYHLLSLLVQ